MLGYVQNRRRSALEMVRRLKEENACADCGRRYPYFVMDFDHVSGEKKYEVADMAARAFSEKSILEEIAKCELVCSNCHRFRTFNRHNGTIG